MQELFDHIHFIGVGGVGMSGIARVLAEQGKKVSGSDLKKSGITSGLEKLGAVIFEGHAAENLPQETEIVVVSSAIREDNPEVVEAKKRNLPIWQRAKMLAYLMRQKSGIAVAGAHGKTTTSSMIATILEKNAFDPTVVIGGIVNDLGINAKLGQGDYLVAEADESDGSMVNLLPLATVVTNIEDDHLDHYGTVENIRAAFVQYINQLPDNGFALLCWDDANIHLIKDKLSSRCLTYGINNEADYMAKDIAFAKLGSSFQVWQRGRNLGTIKLKIPGLHNVYNALAAAGVCLEIGMPFAKISQVLADFKGVQRRFQLIGNLDAETIIVDDYAHHPTEIKAVLQAARNGWQGRLIAVFQPHRYTRTKLLYQEFMQAFDAVDLLLMNTIYAASEDPIEGVSAEKLARDIAEAKGKEVLFFAEKEEIVDYLAANFATGDLIVTVGAGDVCQIGPCLLEKCLGRKANG